MTKQEMTPKIGRQARWQLFRAVPVVTLIISSVIALLAGAGGGEVGEGAQYASEAHKTVALWALGSVLVSFFSIVICMSMEDTGGC